MNPSTNSSRPWAVRLPSGSMGAAAGLRLWPGLCVRVDDEIGGLWLRGDELTPALELELRKLPGAERFAIDRLGGEEVLQPVGRRLPAGFVPTGTWTPIIGWFRPVLPVAALAASMPVRSPLTLVRSGRPADANVLVATLTAWTAWASEAPRVRLRRLSFAASGDRRVVIRGHPLPPIPGVPYVERLGVAVPNGWEVRPSVDAATLRSLLGIVETDLAFVHEGGGWERVPADGFVVASRSSARTTANATSDVP